MIRALLIFACAIFSLTQAQASNQSTDPPMVEFFKGICGEWVGVCRQSTDGKFAEDKYFHAVVSETAAGSYEAKFEYFAIDTNRTMIKIGGSTITTTLASDGISATGTVIGNGEVLLDKKPKKQEHVVTEVLTCCKSGVLQAKGSGSLKVYGLPLGVGQSGKVRDETSHWTLSNGALSITQNMSIAFRALCFSKVFRVAASYTAVRGKDFSQLCQVKSAAESAR